MKLFNVVIPFFALMQIIRYNLTFKYLNGGDDVSIKDFFPVNPFVRFDARIDAFITHYLPFSKDEGERERFRKRINMLSFVSWIFIFVILIVLISSK